MLKKILSLIVAFTVTNAIAQRINPIDVIGVCSNQNIGANTPSSTSYTTLHTACGPNDPLTSSLALYYVEIESGTTFTFEITPQANVDYDFASWQNPDFNNLGPSDRGSQNDPTTPQIYKIGLSLDEPEQTCEIPGAAPPTQTGQIPGMVRYYDVQPGDGILIAINRWAQTDAGFQLSFGGNATLNCDLAGRVYEKCDEDHDLQESFDLNAIKQDINNAMNSFTIDFFEKAIDAQNQTATNTLSSPYNVTLADSPKKIYARFKRANGVYAKMIEIDLIVNETPKQPKKPIIYELCDLDQNGKEVFDLTLFETSLQEQHLGTTSFHYYETLEQAQDSTATPIATPKNYNSTEKTVYLKMAILEKCPIYVPIKLAPIPFEIKPTTITYSIFCGNPETDGLSFDLRALNNTILENKEATSYTITYHHSLNEAQDKQNKINNPNSLLVPYNESKTVFVRIENERTCYIVSEIQLKSEKRFSIEDQYNELCDPFILPELPNGYAYYTGPNGSGERISINGFDRLIYGGRTIFIYGNHLLIDPQSPEYNSCSYETEFSVYNLDCTVPKGISPNGDTLNDFWDLTAFGVFKLKIYNRYGKEVFTFDQNYTNEWEGQSNSGSKLPDGTYWYIFHSLNGTKTGWVQINR